jgi:hypothetical protein
VETYKEGVGKFFQKLLELRWGDVFKVSFWHDLWGENHPLKISCPDLFSIAHCKDVWVADLMQFRNGSIHWNIIFIRPVQDWEVELVFFYFEMLYSFRVRQRDLDRICWISSQRHTFEVKSFCHVLTIFTGSPFLWKSIWKVKVPSRMVFFVWMVAL